MTLEEGMALADEIAHPDFIEHYAAMKARLRDLEGQQGIAATFQWMVDQGLAHWELLPDGARNLVQTAEELARAEARMVWAHG